MQRRKKTAAEAAADLSALAVARGEKTLEEHELYVEALFAGTNAPPHQRDAWRAVAIALGVVALGAITGLVVVVAADERQPAQPGAAPNASAGAPTEDPPAASDAADTSVSVEDRLEAALKQARQAYFDAVLVTRAEKRQKPEVWGGSCQRPIPGRTLLDDAYMCNTWERALVDVPPGINEPVPPAEQLHAEWKVTLDSRSCWKATPLHEPTIVASADQAPLSGCLDRPRP